MSQRIWDKFLTQRDKAVFAAGGFGARAGFGKRPALLVIDVNWAFCSERPEPILESIKRWRTSCGEESWVALEYIKQLIETARARGLPVIYTTGERRPDNWDAGSWRWKSTRSDEASGNTRDDIDGNEIVTTIAPGPRDIVIKKQKPSGFFGTNLASYLTLFGCDSLIVKAVGTCSGAPGRGSADVNHRWREMDSNLYGAFPVKWLFWVLLRVLCSERESRSSSRRLRSGSRSARKGSRDRNASIAWRLAA